MKLNRLHLANGITNKQLISIIYKEFPQLSIEKKQAAQLENGQRTWTDIPQKTYKWAMVHEKQLDITNFHRNAKQNHNEIALPFWQNG